MTVLFPVLICSTFIDLIQARDAVLDAIRRLKLQHDSMEFFGAREAQPIETCLKEVRASDVLVVIVGHRYGSVVPDLGMSYSEAEYEEGFKLKKPCLVYMRGDNVRILPRHMERDSEKLKLLEKWKGTLQSRHTVFTFQDGANLAVQVAADLAGTIQELEAVTKSQRNSTKRWCYHADDRCRNRRIGRAQPGRTRSFIAFGNSQCSVFATCHDAKERTPCVSELRIRRQTHS